MFKINKRLYHVFLIDAVLCVLANEEPHVEQEQERWIWGPLPENYSISIDNKIKYNSTMLPPVTTTTTTERSIKKGPSLRELEYKRECERPLPTNPDLSNSGLRISEVKCADYVFDIILRDAEHVQHNGCANYYCLKTVRECFENPECLQFPPCGIRGRDAHPREFPHMVGIGWRGSQKPWEFKCGGSLISERYVLTAAHCSRTTTTDTSVLDPVPTLVRKQDISLEEVRTSKKTWDDSNISRIIVHPRYKPPNKYYDIALIEMELDEKMLRRFTDSIHPACLWSKISTESLGVQATSTGWGVYDLETRATAVILQVVDLDLMASDECDQLLHQRRNRHWKGIADHQICAWNKRTWADSCQGDSGGPLQVKFDELIGPNNVYMHYLVGVTSFGFGCGVEDTPGVYTRVASFIDWIEDIVWPRNGTTS